MSHDLIGKRGIGYHNNCWVWRPLWLLVCNTCQDILTAKDITMGGFNNGHVISSRKAVLIADRLKNLPDKKFMMERVNQIMKCLDDAYEIDESNLKEFIAFCQKSGGFEIC